jgi:hypothetical protein
MGAVLVFTSVTQRYYEIFEPMTPFLEKSTFYIISLGFALMALSALPYVAPEILKIKKHLFSPKKQTEKK